MVDLKKYIFIFFLFLNISFLYSQNIESKNFTLKWNDDSTVQIGANQSVSIPLIENNFFNKNNIPTYVTMFNVQKNVLVQEYQIKNVKFSNLNNKFTNKINIKDIPTEIISEFNIGKSKNKSLAILSISPLVYINGRIKKIESFTLDYKLTSNNSLNKSNSSIPIYTNNSVLSSGTWYKFAVDTTGVFKIDKDLLNKIGISTNNLDPNNIRLYGNGGALLPQLNSEFRYDDLQENAIFIEGGEDGSFDNGDFILFYAKGPHSWKKNPLVFNLTKHQNNIYSDRAFYFITIDNGIGKRIKPANTVAQPSDQIITNFQDYLFHEIDKINRFANGQQWLGEDFSFDEVQTFQFNFDNIDNSEEITLRIRGVAESSTATTMNAKINGQEILSLNFRAIPAKSLTLATTAEMFNSITINQDQINVEITYNNLGNPSANAFLDYIEILGTKKLIVNNKQFSFRNFNTLEDKRIFEYQIQNSSNILQLWDVSDFINPKQIENEAINGDNFVFKSLGNGTIKEFIVINDNDFLIPETIDDNLVNNQNLHQLKDVDYIIITQDYLINQAERLADYHRINNNLNTLVIDLNQIYNEFGSGSPDLTAIRDFIRFLYLTASTNENRIRYVCLFGDSSFDFKDRITNNNNIVPAFQSFESFNLAISYVTDDYFGLMDDNEGLLTSFDMQDVATGRFPITTVLEAKETIDKTLNYYKTTSFGDWRNNITFIADDPDEPSEFVLQKGVDIIAEDVKLNKPEFNIKKIYSDAHQQETSAGGERYPTVNEAITNSVEIGTLVIDYFGHGGVNGWANERILEVPQIQGWNNPNNLPLFITVTCEYSRFDNPIKPTAGEFTFLNKNGGAINMITTTREIFISVGQAFNSSLVKKLFNFQNENYSIAEALMFTKHEFGSIQRFFVYNFGDPAMKLAQPKPNILITKINGKDILQSRDTLKALSHINMEGVVTDKNNAILNNFNGTLTATIYDKELDKTTLDNDNFGRKMEFTSIESKIFRGRASVTNGIFKFDFIVPKDIRIAFGKAKISFYAEDNLI